MAKKQKPDDAAIEAALDILNELRRRDPQIIERLKEQQKGKKR